MKLFYRLYKFNVDRTEEKDLRVKHNLQNMPQNRHIVQKKRNGSTRVGKGSKGYCHWCDIKYEHNTIYCREYCPLCKQEGHWWGDCTKHQEKAQERVRNLQKELADMKF